MVKVFCDDCGKEVYMPKYYGEVDIATYVRNAEMYDGVRFYYDAKTNVCLDLCEQCMQKRRGLNDRETRV